MPRLALIAAVAVALVTLAGSGAPVANEARASALTEVVVALGSPPLAQAPGSGARIASEQQAFRAALAREIPQARVRWRYRLVANGFAVVLPEKDAHRLHAVSGVREVFDSVRYEQQLDGTPQAIGAPGLWGAGLDTAGQGVKIGILDTGVDHAHPFFDPSSYTMPAGFPKGQTRFTNAKVIVARAFAPPGAQYPNADVAVDGENSAHGTHVAGIAAGNPRTPGAGRTVSGIAPRAFIGNYKCLVGTDSGLSPNGNAPEIVAAIEAAVRDGMDVLNLSIGEPEIEPRRDVVALALDAASAAGVVSVVAAGNEYNDVGAGSVSSPANAATAITVAAFELSGTGSTGVHADFSSVGPAPISLRQKPDVAAPGVDVLSAVPEGWSSFSGTSMASPHVAGAAALLVHRHPAWTPAQIKSALVQTGTDARVDGAGAPGPEFQGGGTVTLARADRPLLFATPSGVSFGLVGRGATIRTQVQLTDAGTGAGTWQVSGVRRESPDGARLTLPASVEVPGTLSFAAVTTGTAGQGVLSGYVELRRGADVRRIPFWGRVAIAGLAKHKPIELRRTGVHRGTTAGRPARAITYRYPENARGVGVTTTLRGPEAVYRVRLRQPVANFGAVVVLQGRGTRVEPRVVAGRDENRLTGIAGLPVARNPYLEGGFHTPVLAAAALSPLPGDYAIVFDSATRQGAGRFTFRFWINDVKAPTLRLRTPSVASGGDVLVGAVDNGSGVYAKTIRASIDGEPVNTTYRRGVIRISTSGIGGGNHRLRLRVSDYQETKNTENVARILPNTRTLTANVTIR